MKTIPPDRSNTVKELEERLLKKWKEKNADKAPDKAPDPKKPISTPPAKKN